MDQLDDKYESFIHLLASMRQKAGAKTPGVDSALYGTNPEALAGLRAMARRRLMQKPGENPLERETFLDLARRAGMEEEAKKQAVAVFGGRRQRKPSPPGYFPGVTNYLKWKPGAEGSKPGAPGPLAYPFEYEEVF